MPIPTDVEVRFVSPLADQLLFHHMDVEEELGRPFKYTLTLLSERGDLVLSDLLGQVVSVELDLPPTTPTPNDGIRYFNGYVTRFSRRGAHRQYHVYSATVRPWLWLLTQTSNCRIFQDKTVPEIIKEVFRSHGLTDFQESLTADYASHEFVVQYRETDFNFVSRLMEFEGIYYFFKHEAPKHTLILADSYSAHDTVNGYEEVPYIRPGSLQQSLPDHLDDWELAQQIEPGTVILNDFNFETPKANLLTKRSAPNPHEKADFEDYDYPGKYLKSDGGETYARLRLEEMDAHYEQVKARGNARGLTVGSLFEPTNLPVDSDNREYLITATAFAIEGPNYESQEGGRSEETIRCTVAAINSKCPFRTERSAPRPTVAGPQTATVVGQDGEEIWTDKYGRVKVQFHWDREGKRDENSSCWVRVAQVWAGTQWGAMHIPRIGQEVIVDFLEGDPDKPIITGRVYNADNMPPYTLPDNKTQSGIKSRSTKGGTANNFNEIRFEDLKGKEELHMQAELDMSTNVKRNQTLYVGGDQNVTIHGNQTISVHGTDEKTGKKLPVQSVTKVTGKHTFDASDTIKIQAPTSITLECGGSTIVLTPGSITLTSGGKSTVVLDTEVLTKASGGANTKHNADVLHKSNAGAQIKLDANVLAKSVPGAQLQLDDKVGAKSVPGSELTLDGNATLSGKGTATVQAPGGVTVSGGGGTVKADPSGVTASGAKVGLSGAGMVNIAGGIVKIN